MPFAPLPDGFRQLVTYLEPSSGSEDNTARPSGEPPYNTGNDFVYVDDFAESSTDYLANSGQQLATGDRLMANTETNGRFHSDWLSMMYSRLNLARGLLADDGVVIVAIDDHEHGNLRVLLDQVFGSQNFLANVVWQGGSKNDARFTSQGLDYMLIYARNVQRLIELDVRWTEQKQGIDRVLELAAEAWRSSKHDSTLATKLYRAQLRKIRSELEPAVFRYDQIDDQGRVYQTGDLRKPTPTSRSRYEILHPVTGRPVPMHPNGWVYAPESMEAMIREGRILFGVDHTIMPRQKRYLEEMGSQAIKPVFTRERASAAYALKKLLDSDVFPYTKDVGILAKWINAVTQGDREAVVLDFFAGSGSTGHAVMDLNATDGGHRRYILVQLDEHVENPNYGSIASIARERLRRAGAQVKESAGLLGADLDVGFRSLHVASTNMADTLATAEELEQLTLSEAVGSVKPDRTDEDLLFQVLLDWGLDLGESIAVDEIDGRRVLAIAEGALIACFSAEVTEAVVREMAGRHPLRAVFLDAGFASDAVRINAEQIFREVSPETEVRAI